MLDAHFPGCHPEHDRDDRETPEPANGTDECWHCKTPTTRGACRCADCYEGADDIPVEAVYHCPLCKRWWAFMRLNITKITFGEVSDAAVDG